MITLVLVVLSGVPAASHAPSGESPPSSAVASIAAAASMPVQPAASSALPDPYKTTEYNASRHEYRLTIDGVRRDVVAYLPVPENPMLAVVDRPIIVLLHATGGNYGPDSYKGMMEFLAKNGFVVVAPTWDAHAYSVVDQNADTASEVYGSPARVIKTVIDDSYRRFEAHTFSDQVVLMGHSVGGAGVVRAADAIGNTWIHDRRVRIKSVVAMAPAPKDRDMRERHALAGKSSSFLVMMVAKDEDIHGIGSPDSVRDTGFKLYDVAGSEENLSANAAALYPDKDLLFIKGGSHSTFRGTDPSLSGTMYSYRRFAAAYVNAYLRRHVYGEKVYDAYLLDGVRSPSSPDTLVYRQAHSSKNKLVVENFQRGQGSTGSFYGGGSSSVGRIISSSTALSFTRENSHRLTDSPHATRVLVTTWNTGATPYLEFDYANDQRVDVSQYKYLGIRIGQIHNHRHNEVDTGKDLSVRLLTMSNGSRVLSDGARMHVPYPFREWVRPQGQGTAEATKSAMHTVIIPLDSFGAGVNLKNVDGLRIYLPGKGQVQIDNIEFFGERTVVPVY